MHALWTAAEQTAHGSRGGRRLAARARCRRHREPELVDDAAHFRLSRLREPPFDRLVEGACEGNECPAVARSAAPRAGFGKACSGAVAIVIERIDTVAQLVGDADRRNDLAGRSNTPDFASGLVVAGRCTARMRRSEIRRRVRRLEIAQDLAVEAGGDDNDVRALQSGTGRDFRWIERVSGRKPCAPLLLHAR